MIRPAIALAFLAACGGSPPPEPPKAEAPAAEVPPPAAPVAEVPAQHRALFKAVSPVPVAPADKDLVELGRMLYYENRLSVMQNQSCNTCHQLENWGVDNQAVSLGSKGQRGGRNSQTVYGAYTHFAQFWDGRAPTVEEQAKGPILNPIEMGMKDEKSVLAVLESIPGYQEAFSRTFPADTPSITYDNLAKAIGAFERHLVTPSRFDTYLNGDVGALSDDEKKGLDTFIAAGCTACHMGDQLGGQMFQKLGLVVPYPTKDLGRYDVTKNEADKYFFKVPSLRNVAKTGPWFHDGGVATLEEAVSLMGKHQLGKELTPEETASIVTFLQVLTGEIDKAYIAQPQLPPSGPKTPGPGKG